MPAGTTVDWTSFQFAEGAVVYAGGGEGGGRWVAFPDSGIEKREPSDRQSGTVKDGNGVVVTAEKRGSKQEGTVKDANGAVSVTEKRGETWSVKWKDGEFGFLAQCFFCCGVSRAHVLLTLFFL